MIIIERKTWEDLASSFRDGRSENINKLKELRTAVNCQIAYIIEGDPFPKSNKLYSRMPAKNLRAHLDHIAFRDNIQIIHTKNQEYTANRLFELARNYSTIKPSPFIRIEELIKEQSKEETSDNDDGDNTDTKTNTTMLGNSEQLTKKQTACINIQEQLLQCLPGIGSIVSTLLAEQGVSLYSLYHGIHTSDDLARIKFPTGSSIGLVRAKKIIDNIKLINGVSQSQLAKKIQVRILSTIPLVSATSAKKILEIIELKDIFNGTVYVDLLKDISRTEKSKLGAKVANNILEYLIVKKDANEENDKSDNKESEDANEEDGDNKEEESEDESDNKEEDKSEEDNKSDKDMEDSKKKGNSKKKAK
jgi:ERCC4-type nuclease